MTVEGRSASDAGPDESPPVRVTAVQELTDGWCRVRKYTFDYRRRDGVRQRMVHVVCHRGDTVVVLPYSPANNTVVLTRQFRLPAYLAGGGGFVIEAAGGRIEDDGREESVRREAEEELGLRLSDIREILVGHLNPSVLTERTHFFLATFNASTGDHSGGGLTVEGEDIEVLHLTLDEAMRMVRDGQIADVKTILLLQYVTITGQASAD